MLPLHNFVDHKINHLNIVILQQMIYFQYHINFDIHEDIVDKLIRLRQNYERDDVHEQYLTKQLESFCLSFHTLEKGSYIDR